MDDVREKYQRACRRLHLVHNEYVLLIAEAQESEKDFQTVMMPAFMQHHQQELENIIIDWLVWIMNHKINNYTVKSSMEVDLIIQFENYLNNNFFIIIYCIILN